MPDNSVLKNCACYLVRYVPNAEREEFVNIGLFLHCAEEQFLDCLFTHDLRRVKRFHPQADTEFLGELQGYFEEQIQRYENHLEIFLEEMQQSYSNVIQIAPPRSLLAAQPQEQMLQLFERFVGARPKDLPAADTRMRIKQTLVGALRRTGVMDHPRFERQIPAESLTHPGDPFHFDFGYRPLKAHSEANGHLKLIHCLSLRRDPKLASVLSTTTGYVRARQPAEVTAIIEGWPARGDKTASHSRRVLEDAHIVLRPVSESEAFAAAVREELSLSAAL